MNKIRELVSAPLTDGESHLWRRGSRERESDLRAWKMEMVTYDQRGDRVTYMHEEKG